MDIYCVVLVLFAARLSLVFVVVKVVADARELAVATVCTTSPCNGYASCGGGFGE